MDKKEFFINLITNFLNGDLTRAEVADEIWSNIPIETDSKEEKDELLINCEWALRHMNEAAYETSEREIKYYLDCLQDREIFSIAERDKIISTGLVETISNKSN